MTDTYMLTISEAAEELGVSETMLRDEIASGKLKAIPWGNERRIPRWYLVKWQAEKLGFNESAVSKLLTE